jgi:hypothetical protein
MSSADNASNLPQTCSVFPVFVFSRYFTYISDVPASCKARISETVLRALAGAARPRGREDDDDLHARPQSRRRGVVSPFDLT